MKLLKPVRVHGGKDPLADWILSHFPPRFSDKNPDGWFLYREPYFGGGSVLLRQNPLGISEVVNDLDGELMNFWRCLQNPLAFRLMERQLSLTPFSDTEWEDRKQVNGQKADLDRAIDFFVRSRMSRQGLKKDFATPTSRIRRGMSENVAAYLSAIEGLRDVHERLRRVEIRNVPAVDFIKKYDHPRSTTYCDPPYLHETRTATDAYGEFEMSYADHEELLDTLAGVKGNFVLSGYHSPLYDSYAGKHGWRIEERQVSNHASSSKIKEVKTEILVMNY